MDPEADIYESDPDMRPDSEFEPGSLALLVPGNAGRLLDPRRTPVSVVAADAERGSFTVRVEAFEDAGVTWELFLAEVTRFHFERGADRLGSAEVGRLDAARARFDKPLCIDADPKDRAASIREIAKRRARVAAAVAELDLSTDLISQAIDDRIGTGPAFRLTERLLTDQRLAGLEQELLGPLISNPRSGEMVKGHAVVLADLGLCPYRGRVVRDPHLFDGSKSREARRDHILWRMALTQEIWANAQEPTVYRVVSSDHGIEPGSPSLVSGTFSEAVAESHIGGGTTRRHSKLITRSLPLHRLFMTFLETEAMNEPYREAEALFVGSPGSFL
jgi:hypothetical protein